MDLGHSDPIDAFVSADRLRLGRDLPAPFHYEERYFPLRLLTRYRYHVVHNLVREKAYCLAILYLKASEYTSIKPFANVFGAASRAVLQEFNSIEEIAAIPFHELVEFIDLKGKRRFPDPEKNARKLQQVARDSYHLPETLKQPINLILGMSLKHISFLEGQEKRLANAIAERMELIPHTLDTIPGFGLVFSGGIIAEIGDLARFDYNQAKVAKFADFKWRKHQSLISRLRRPSLPVPAIATCATTSARRPTGFGCATQSMPPIMTASFTRCASTNTSGPSCSPPASWCGC